MLHYPHFNPVAFKVGQFKVHWYGLMYLLGFFLVGLLANYRINKQAWVPLKNNDQVMDAVFYGAVGVVIGGRLGYMLFYDFANFISNPLIIFKVWDGGMSFHGGLLGVIIALFWFSRRLHINAFELTDFFAPLAPIGLGLGRLGNFINGELWGRVTTSPVGMVFPTGGPLPRYPSELLELFLEGICLFSVLWVLSLKPRPRMYLSGCFLIGYSLCRIVAEFFRVPDPQLGYLAFGWLTMGQLLSLPMLALGLFLLCKSTKNPTPHEA